jgi:RNA polymerase sigma-70 factor (ECF subfamily)
VNSGWQHATAGEPAWDQWVAQHAPRLLLFARQQARCEADAQDLVQDAVVETWRHQPDGATPPLALVYATIRRRAVDLVRREDRRASREAASHFEVAPQWFEPDVEERERSRLIEHAMRTLPEMYREVVTLKVWGELTFAQIALALEIPANTAASRYRYGLAELRKLTTGTLA